MEHFHALALAHLQSIFRKLETALNSPGLPTACPFDIYAWFLSIASAEKQWDDLSIRERDMIYQTFDLTNKWLFRPRSPEAIANFYDSLDCDCTAEHQQRMDHVNAKKDFETRSIVNIPGPYPYQTGLGKPSWYLLHAFTFRFINFVKQGDNESHTRTLRRIRRRTRWPNSLQSIFPYGPLVTLKGILQWCKRTPQPNLRVIRDFYDVFNVLTYLARPIVLPYLITSSDFIRHMIVLPIKQLQSYYPGASQHIDDQFVKACEDTCYFITFLSDFLNRLVWLECTPAEREIFFRNGAQELLDAYLFVVQTCKEMVTLLGLTNDPRLMKLDQQEMAKCQKNMLSRALEVVIEFGPDTLKLRSGNKTHQVIRTAAVESRRDNRRSYTTWDLLIQEIFRLQYGENQTCLSPNCNITVLDDRLKQCVGCKRVYYCSRECQRRAWCHVLVPHRSVCGLLAQICHDYNIPLTGIRDISREMDDHSAEIRESGKLLLAHFRTLAELKLTPFTNLLV